MSRKEGRPLDRRARLHSTLWSGRQEHTPQPERLAGQLDHFMSLVSDYNKTLPDHERRSDRDLLYLHKFFEKFKTGRDKRAGEIHTGRYREIAREANTHFPLKTYFVHCIDGRVKPVHTNGMTADVGRSMRLPAATIKEVVRGRNGKMRLLQSSSFAKQLDIALSKSNEIAQVLDSHIGCAARGIEEAAQGKTPADGGLYDDVLEKKQIAQALRDYAAEKPDGKKLVAIQTSFNPNNGFMYMGLETDAAIDYAKAQAANIDNNPRAAINPAFTPTILDTLIHSGAIISTKHLIDIPVVRQLFEQHQFPVDWVNQYVPSADRFWKGIKAMKPTLLPGVIELLKGIYPPETHSPEELEERAMLLITNAFNGYLHNERPSDQAQYSPYIPDTHEEHTTYRYGKHEEEGVKASNKGGHPPYDVSMLVVNSSDIDNLPAHIETGSRIVRSTRLTGGIQDWSKLYSTPEEFSQAPMPIVVQEIPNGEFVDLKDADWREFQQIDWKDLSAIEINGVTKSWDTLSDEEFGSYLEGKSKRLHADIKNAVVNLRRKMLKLYDKYSTTSPHLLNLYKVALPIICNEERLTMAIIPFIKLGYSEDEVKGAA